MLGIFRKVVEEESEKSIDILARSDRVAHAVAAVGVAHIDGLIEEDNGGIVVPRVWVIDELNLLVDRSGSQLKEESSERRAAWAAVEPKNDGVILGVIAGLKKPCKIQQVLDLYNQY